MSPSRRICPGCGRNPRRKHICAHCDYSSDSGLPLVADLVAGVATGGEWNQVDVGRLFAFAFKLGRSREATPESAGESRPGHLDPCAGQEVAGVVDEWTYDGAPFDDVAYDRKQHGIPSMPADVPDCRAAVEDLAAELGVTIAGDRQPGEPAYPWSFHVGDNERPMDLHAVGPRVVYWRRDAANPSGPGGGPVPWWAILLHEIGHAVTGSADEDLVAAWTDAAAAELGPGALEVMRAYDVTTDAQAAANRARGIRLGILSADGRIKRGGPARGPVVDYR